MFVKLLAAGSKPGPFLSEPGEQPAPSSAAPSSRTMTSVGPEGELQEMARSMLRNGTRSRRARAALQPGSQHGDLGELVRRAVAVLGQPADVSQASQRLPCADEAAVEGRFGEMWALHTGGYRLPAGDGAVHRPRGLRIRRQRDAIMVGMSWAPLLSAVIGAVIVLGSSLLVDVRRDRSQRGREHQQERRRQAARNLRRSGASPIARLRWIAPRGSGDLRVRPHGR
jgi:hypothetical protein